MTNRPAFVRVDNETIIVVINDNKAFRWEAYKRIDDDHTRKIRRACTREYRLAANAAFRWLKKKK